MVASCAGGCLAPALDLGGCGVPGAVPLGKASSHLPGASLGPAAGCSTLVHILGSEAGGCMAALAAFLTGRSEAGMETGDELEAPSVAADPAGFVWTRLSGSG